MTATPAAQEITLTAARAAASKKGEDIVAIDVSDRLHLTDVFLLVAASNERQVGAVVDAVEDALREAGVKAVRREGMQQARWVLLDFGDVVVHVQHEEDRETFALHRLWGECPTIELPQDVHDGSLVPADDAPVRQYVPAPLLDQQ